MPVPGRRSISPPVGRVFSGRQSVSVTSRSTLTLDVHPRDSLAPSAPRVRPPTAGAAVGSGAAAARAASNGGGGGGQDATNGGGTSTHRPQTATGASPMSRRFSYAGPNGGGSTGRLTAEPDFNGTILNSSNRHSNQIDAWLGGGDAAGEDIGGGGGGKEYYNSPYYAAPPPLRSSLEMVPAADRDPRRPSTANTTRLYRSSMVGGQQPSAGARPFHLVHRFYCIGPHIGPLHYWSIHWSTHWSIHWSTHWSIHWSTHPTFTSRRRLHWTLFQRRLSPPTSD